MPTPALAIIIKALIAQWAIFIAFLHPFVGFDHQ
jgi:hypothetical protein